MDGRLRFLKLSVPPCPLSSTFRFSPASGFRQTPPANILRRNIRASLTVSARFGKRPPRFASPWGSRLLQAPQSRLPRECSPSPDEPSHAGASWAESARFLLSKPFCAPGRNRKTPRKSRSPPRRAFPRFSPFLPLKPLKLPKNSFRPLLLETPPRPRFLIPLRWGRAIR